MHNELSDLRPNKTLSAMLAGKRAIEIDAVHELDGLAETFAALEFDLFPTNAQQRAQWAKNRAEMPVEDIIRYFELDKHFPQTLAKWIPTDDEPILRQRILWLYDYVRGAPPYKAERLIIPYENQPAGAALWDICPI